MGFDSVKFLLSNDDVFVPGGSQVTQYTAAEADAAGEQARESGVWLNCHAQSAESVKLAVRAGFRTISPAPTPTKRLSTCSSRSRTTSSCPLRRASSTPTSTRAPEFGIDYAMAEKMGSVAALEGMAAIYPEIRRRGIRALPGGDYGFPNNPIGRNARDLQLFVEVLGYSPLETLTAATRLGGQLRAWATSSASWLPATSPTCWSSAETRPRTSGCSRTGRTSCASCRPGDSTSSWCIRPR